MHEMTPITDTNSTRAVRDENDRAATSVIDSGSPPIERTGEAEFNFETDHEQSRDGREEENDANIAGECALNSSAATDASSATSQTSSSGSRKSRRTSFRSEKFAPSFRPYDPMRVVTQEQLEAFSLLVSTPIWIFDFIERKNRYSNPAGLDLWSAPSLDEFLNRSMTDMSPASVARTQECQNRIERAQVVQDMWTFYPKGKARTVQMTMTAVRLSPEEDHCSIFVVANMITSSPSISNNVLNARNKTENSQATTTSMKTKAVSDTNKDLNSKQNTIDSATNVKERNPDEIIKKSDSSNCFHQVLFQEEIKNECACSVEGGEIQGEKNGDDMIPPDNISKVRSTKSTCHHQMTEIDSDNPLNQEILRGVEIIRHLPMAVCQFDLKGRVMFQNPAAYLPPLDDEEEKEIEDDEFSMDTDDDSEYYDRLFEQQHGGVQTISSNNGRGNFMDRFVNKKVARELLDSLQDKPKEIQSGSVPSNSVSIIVPSEDLTNSTTVSIEAELHTSTGRTQWSAIQLRKTKDPVTSRPVILYSAQDKSDAMEAKREREARLQKSEFLAIMAHEIRTPLHQVTGFIDLLELDACNTPIATTASSSAIMNNDSSTQNALFPPSTVRPDGTIVSPFSRPSTVRKSRSTSLINTRSQRWPSTSITRQPIGNLTGEQRGYIKLLKSSANQLMTVISDVLDYSKLEAGKMKTERIPFELLSVVQGSMEAVRGSCEEKGLSLTLEYGGTDDDVCSFGHDEVSHDGSGANNVINDRRKTIRRRRSFDEKTRDLKPSRRRMGRTHSFSKKTKCDSHPNIKSNDIPFRILGDPNRLRQVLLNFLSNAVKFTEKGGIHVRVSSFATKNSSGGKAESMILQSTNGSPTAIRRSSSSSLLERKEGRRRSRRLSMSSSSSSVSLVETNVEGRVTNKSQSGTSNSCSTARTKIVKEKSPLSLKIVVTDTGMGISKEQQDTIFEKYQQANLSVARNFGGTGLGLSICKLLVEEIMGGSIGVDSDEGRGSSFYFTLPIEVPRESSDDTSRGVNGGEENQKNGASMNVLVAEDNKINQKLVANMLKRMGHKSTLVENGRQAIEMIVKQQVQQESSSTDCSMQSKGYDAVLMDIQMPVMDGLEATRRLRTMGYTDLPILGLTASVKRSDYIELGFNDWLPKPILMKDLKAKLLKLCTYNSEDSDESNVK